MQQDVLISRYLANSDDGVRRAQPATGDSAAEVAAEAAEAAGPRR